MSEPRAIEQTLTIPYSWGYGAGLEMFFSGTRDRKIIGLRCPSCEGVIVPPSEVCGRCFAQLDWDQPVELPPRARLESWTEIHLPFPGQPTQPPYILGLICFEGAATLFTHLIGETEEDKLALGLPLDVIWAEERSGDLYDIQHLRPADPALRVAPRRFAPTIGVDQDAEPWEPPVPQDQMTPVERIVYALPPRFVPEQAGDWQAAVQFIFGGDGGGSYWVEVAGGRCTAGPGEHSSPTATVKTKANTWLGMAAGTVNPQLAFVTGRIRVKGTIADVQRLNDRTLFERKG